jgi:O-succinylbenzoic acid--CoA ligase
VPSLVFPTPDDLPRALALLLDGADHVVVAGGTVDPADCPDQPGVVVFTSGSTGAAKAVVLPVTALRAAADMAHAWLGGPGDWLTALPTHYVAGLMTVVRAHVGGGRWATVASDLSDLGRWRIPGSGPGQAGADAPSAMTRAYLSIVPTQLVRALDDPATTAALAKLDAVLVGGAALDVTTRERAEQAGIKLVRTYGMSETAGGVVYNGEPLPGVTIGFDAGRILLTTPSACAGYLGDPEATAAVLDGQTVRTQDTGHLDAQGRLVVTGRLDATVQSGGVNVDLTRLQRRLDEIWGVHEIVAFAVPDSLWGSRIMAATTGPVSVDEIVGRLGDQVTAAARPRAVFTVPALPLTPSGKPDRRKLAELWQERGGTRGERA